MSEAQQQTTRKGEVQVEEPARPQQVVARRVAEAKAIVPEFSVQTVADVTRALALTSDEVTIDDVVVKAAALALRALPRTNGAFRDGHFERYGRVNVGIAVAAGPATLAVPTLFDADTKPLAAIAAESRALAEQVRAGTIRSADLAGATFTVSSVARHAVTAYEPIIIAPQAAGLGVGAVHDAVVAHDGQAVVRPVLALTLVADHRILYGDDAAELVARIKALLEDPASLAG